MRVLVVEDDEATRLSIGRRLGEVGINCASISNGEGAVSCARPVQGFNAIILDLTLPDVSGYEVIEAIRKAGFLIPILVLTEDASIESKVHALSLGADDYMTKPFHKDELVARLRAIIRGRGYGQVQALETAVSLARAG